MSRDASMRRQASSAGGNNVGTPGSRTGALIKSEHTPKFGDSRQPGPGGAGKAEQSRESAVAEDAWANTTIDPSSLFVGFTSMDTATGVIADINTYRSLTPHDTPESSKDSGASEPNSDISEGMNLDIDMSYQAFDDGLMMGMHEFSMDQFHDHGGDLGGYHDMSGGMGGEADYGLTLDDFHNDFDKPFHFDAAASGFGMGSRQE